MGIVVHPGSVVHTLSDFGSVYMEAHVKETFENPLKIFNLSEFLNVVSLLTTNDEAPEIEIEEKVVRLVGKSGVATFVQADESQIKHRPAGKKLQEYEALSEFVLDPEIISTIKATQKTLKHCVFHCEGSNVTLHVKDIKDPSTTVLSFQVGDGIKDFSAICLSDVFSKLIPVEDGYNISITEKLIKASSRDGKITYWMGLEQESKF